MIKLPLYSGDGVSLSPENAEGRVLSNYVRLVADGNLAITNGTTTTICADVLKSDVDSWSDCEFIDDLYDEATTEDLYNALAELGVS